MRLQRTLLALSLLLSTSALAQTTTTELVTVAMSSGSSSFNRAKCQSDTLSFTYTASSELITAGYSNVKVLAYVTANTSCPATIAKEDHTLKAETTLTAANLSEVLTFSPKSSKVLKDKCLPNVSENFTVCVVVKYTIPAVYPAQSTDGDAQDSLTITYDSTPPDAPKITKVTPGDGRLVVDWTGQDDIDTWTLYYRKTGADAGVGAGPDAGEGGGTGGATCTPSCSDPTPTCSSTTGKCECTSTSCGTGSSCINGGCVVNSCNPSCSGEMPDCFDTTCKCNDTSCPSGKTCTNGKCELPTCTPACSGETPVCAGTACQCTATSCTDGKVCDETDKVCVTPSFNPTGWISGAVITGGSITTGEVRNLENDQPYEVVLVATDKAGNVSPGGTPVTKTPLRVDDFFRRYRGAGGEEMGGFGCSSAGMVAVPAVAISILALLRRRRGA